VKPNKGLAAKVAVPIGVVGIIMLLVVPVPSWLLDVLIIVNIMLALVVLLTTMFVKKPLDFSVFPSLLLVATLFRLGLNVASTRLVLGDGFAGQVIQAFGHVAVGGSIIIGAVVFLILVVIQFIVVTKGAERVAEVGARFVLDAMPGTQMAIDAELRSGAIDGHEARRRRRSLARESQFYGSMDGAMKFVKGDVIASLVITVVNILGGLAIGVGQKGMPAVDALKRYGLLTIGDGLVSQIPALVLSTAAGVLVTRVASEDPDTPLGEELASQLFGMPKALKVASGFVLLLAIVPGLPPVPFLVLSALLFLVARTRTKQIELAERRAATEPTRPAPTGKRETAFVPVVVPWSIEVSEDLAALLDDATETPGLRSEALGLRDVLFAELGVPLPSPRVRVVAGLPAKHAVVSLFEVPTRVLSIADEGAAVTTIRDATADLLRARGGDFLGLAETQRLLDELEQFAPATVRNVVPKPVSLTLLTDVLRRLVEERVSIRDLRAILEALASLATTEKDPLTLTELVRAQLRRAMTFKLTRGATQLGVVLVDAMIEDTVRRAIQRTPAGAFLTLPPAAARDVIASFRRAAGEATAQGGAPVVLTQPDIRRFVRKLIESDLPDATVVSFAELLPEVTLRPLARANLAGIG
jgi:type III secretion protein V